MVAAKLDGVCHGVLQVPRAFHVMQKLDSMFETTFECSA